VVSLLGIPRRVLRALVIQKGTSRNEESRVHGTRMRILEQEQEWWMNDKEKEKMGLVT